MTFQNLRKHPQEDRKVLTFRVGNSMEGGRGLKQDNSPWSFAPELPSLGLEAPPNLVLKGRNGTALASPPGTQLSREQRPTEGSRRARLPGVGGDGGGCCPSSRLLPRP